MTTRNYSSVSPLTTLSSGVTAADTTLTVASAGPWPSVPFTLILGYDTVDEEVAEVTAISGGGSTFTVTRGVDGTTAKSHSAGSPVVHGVSARDFTEVHQHAATTSGNPHGVTAAEVGAVPVTSVGAADGVASLDPAGQVPASQLGNAAGGLDPFLLMGA